MPHHDFEHFADLDNDDLTAYRNIMAKTMYSQIKQDVSFDDAVSYQLDYYEFMLHIMNKYGIVDEHYAIDEVTGRVFVSDG